jgi:hypothetical protein
MHTYAVVKGKIQQAIARARPCWFLFLKRDQLLLVLSTVQFVLFVPLAWWAHKHPRPPVELAMTHVLQKKRSPFLQLVIRIVSTLTGSSASLNVLVVPTTPCRVLCIGKQPASKQKYGSESCAPKDMRERRKREVF